MLFLQDSNMCEREEAVFMAEVGEVASDAKCKGNNIMFAAG